MGQAAVDLPDPLSAAPVNSGNTDDLLAQLAGEEIERLLAEADEPTAQDKPVDQSSDQASVSPAPPSSAPASSHLETPATSPTPATTAAPKEEQELSALFTQLEGSAPPPPAAIENPVPTPKVEEPSAADALAQEMLEDAAVSGRAALGSDVSQSIHVPHQAEENINTPFLVRLLEWVNRPLENCSDQVRDLIGKVAIMTTVNAAAVLAYVIFVRNH
jgi:hypothetical protein